MTIKRKQSADRERSVLLGLVELYLLTGKPVGSNTLKGHGFEKFSSATIRNYFAKLERDGYLKQQHSSGGRIPTSAAYKVYAAYHLSTKHVDLREREILKKELNCDTREIGTYLQNASEFLSNITQGAIFLSSPRFDQDLIIDLKIIGIDSKRCLIVIITDFGLIHTEIVYTPKRLSTFCLKRIETYFHFRLTGLDRPKLNSQEEEIASGFYNEILMRHIVNYSNFSEEDIYKTGFSKLIRFPEFHDARVLATGLSIFENSAYMRLLLNECMRDGDLKIWIGEDLKHPAASAAQSSIIAVPYFIQGKPVGAVALLGPIRMPYPKLFGLLREFSKILSEVLTGNLYKYKITYRQPKAEQVETKVEPAKITQPDQLQLEDKKLVMDETTDNQAEETIKEERIEIELLKKQIKEEQEKYLLSLADMENSRKRMQKEKLETTRFAVENVIREFLSPLDNFENALSFTHKASEEIQTWAKGFEMILAQFKDILASHNVNAYRSNGLKFDPHFHEVLELEETEKHEDGTIIQEFTKGYKCGERILRPARVKVAKTPIKEEVKDQENNKGEN